MIYTQNRLKKNETKIFFDVDSNHFLFRIQNRSEELSASTWDTPNHKAFIPLSSFDDNNKLMVYFTPSVLGLYTVKFHTLSTDDGAMHSVVNGT